jgi:hypothetical protein
MMKVSSLLVVVFCLVAGSCKQKTVKINMLPAIANSDSAVVMYFHSPGNPRFYNMIKVKGKNPLPVVTTDVNDKVIVAKDTCTTQGKIYFYSKAGAVETIYFSRNNDCMTLSFMKTGEKYFTKMSEKTKQLLDSLEKKVTVLPGRQD